MAELGHRPQLPTNDLMDILSALTEYSGHAAVSVTNASDLDDVQLCVRHRIICQPRLKRQGSSSRFTTDWIYCRTVARASRVGNTTPYLQFVDWLAIDRDEDRDRGIHRGVDIVLRLQLEA